MSRSCGDCTLCCTVMAVPDLAKPGGTPCKDLCTTGCGVYQTRPGVCRNWRCAWLEGAFSEAWRPDRIGVIFAPVMGGAVMGAHVDPQRPDAWRELDLEQAGKAVAVVLNGRAIAWADEHGVRAL